MFPCERSFSIWKWPISSTSPPSMFVKIKNGPMPSHFLSLKIDHFIKIAPHKISNDVNRNPREAQRKIMLCVWYVNLDCIHIHTPFSSARSAEKILYCTINMICSISIYIIYTYNYTHLVRAKRGENMKLYYVYYTTLYCVHISLHLFSSARRQR